MIEPAQRELRMAQAKASQRLARRDTACRSASTMPAATSEKRDVVGERRWCSPAAGWVGEETEDGRCCCCCAVEKESLSMLGVTLPERLRLRLGEAMVRWWGDGEVEGCGHYHVN